MACAQPKIITALSVLLVVLRPALAVETKESQHAAAVRAAHSPVMTQPTTVALLPPHNRAGPEYEQMGHLLSMVVTGWLDRYEGIVPVSRDYLGLVMQEKAMGGAGLTDRSPLARPRRLVGADYTAYTTYGRIDGEFIITTDLIPADATDVDDLYHPVPRVFPRIHSRGADPLVVFRRHAQSLTDALPATVLSYDQTDLPKDLRLGALPFVGWPIELKGEAAVAGNVLAERMAEAKGLIPVEREHLQAVLAEQRLALVGATTLGQQARRAGALMGADLMLVGGVAQVGAIRQYEAQLIEVATGAVLATAAVDSDSALPPIVAALEEQLAKRLRPGWTRTRMLEQHKPPQHEEAISLAVRAFELLQNTATDPWVDRSMQARWLIRAALDLGDESPLALLFVSRAFQELEQYDQVERYLRRAIALAPELAPLHYRLGLLLWFEFDRPADALPHLQEAVRLNKDEMCDVWYESYLGGCLVKLGRVEEALAILHQAEADHNEQVLPYEFLAEAYKVMENHRQSAYWLERAARRDNLKGWRWVKASEAYVRAGNEQKAAEMIEMMIRCDGGILREDWPDLLPILAKTQPQDAANLCYLMIDLERNVEKARDQLQEMGFPQQPRIVNGPVFDIESARGQGVFIYLQPYEDFRYARHLQYVAQYIEDILGIPVRVNDRLRPLVEEDYQRNPDRLAPSLGTDLDLKKVGDEIGADVVIGFTSLQIRSGASGIRWLAGGGQVGRGLVSSQVYDKDLLLFGPQAESAAALSIAHLQRMAIKYAALALLSGVDQGLKECLGQRCLMKKYKGNYSNSYSRLLCLACRNRLHALRPDLAPGPDQREPVDSAAASAVLAEPPARPVLLLGLGGSAQELGLDAAAQAMEASLGMKVQMEVLPQIPDLEADSDGWYSWDTVMDWASEQVRGRELAAACIVVNRSVFNDESSLLNWAMRRSSPDLPSGPDCPLLGVTLYHARWANWPLPQALRHEHAVPFGASQQTLNAPGYTKLLIGGLAIAARNDEPCWTYGCPGTLWYDLTPVQRTSLWLCPECRSSVQGTLDR